MGMTLVADICISTFNTNRIINYLMVLTTLLNQIKWVEVYPNLKLPCNTRFNQVQGSFIYISQSAGSNQY
jgi:hypothetical protein